MVAKLSYVLLDGEPQHVSSFVEIKPRPVVLCSRCRERVDLVLGTQRVHHARHRPGSGCALAGGESALHENVKLHIAVDGRLEARFSERMDRARVRANLATTAAIG